MRAVMDSPDIRRRMKAAGITQMGQMLMLEEMDRGTH
jgi:hypothetical protein